MNSVFVSITQGANIVSSSVAIGGVIHGITAMTKTPLLGQMWHKAPLWARPVFLLVLAFIGAGVDSLATGAPPIIAIINALGGLTVAISSHEMVSLIGEAQAGKRGPEDVSNIPTDVPVVTSVPVAQQQVNIVIDQK